MMAHDGDVIYSDRGPPLKSAKGTTFNWKSTIDQVCYIRAPILPSILRRTRVLEIPRTTFSTAPMAYMPFSHSSSCLQRKPRGQGKEKNKTKYFGFLKTQMNDSELWFSSKS